MWKPTSLPGLMLPYLACFFLVAGTAQAEQEGDTVLTLEEELGGWIDREIEARQIPGAGFALVRGGKLITAKGFGRADLAANKPATAETVFRVGSVSKPVAATALLHLIETSELELETDLRPLLEDLPVAPPLATPLTPHHLLTHTCGFNERLFGQHVRKPADFKSLGHYLTEHLPPRFEEPGRVIAYNDYCTSLAGYVIEKVSGKSFHAYVQQSVFEPLGMTVSTFDQLADEREFSGGLAKSYRWHDGGHEAYARDYIMTTPAAGLYTNAQDMGTWLTHLLSDEGVKVLSPQGLALQKSVQFTHHEKLTGRAYGFASMRFRGHEVYYKDGQAMGFSARLVIVPGTADGFFIVQNRSIFGALGAVNEAGRLARDLTTLFLEQRFPETGEEISLVPPVPNKTDMSAYTGSYRNVVAARHSFEKVITLMDNLVIDSPGPGTLTWGSRNYVEIDEGLFQQHEGKPWYLAFDTKGEGAAKYLFIGGGAYERIPTLSNSVWAPRMLGGLLGISLLILVCAIVPAIRQVPSQSAARKIFLSSALKITGVAGIAACFVLIDLQEFFFGPPLLLSALLALPLLAFALDAWVLVAGVRTVKDTGRAFKTLASLHMFTALGLAWWLNDWNLLGWRYG